MVLFVTLLYKKSQLDILGGTMERHFWVVWDICEVFKKEKLDLLEE